MDKVKWFILINETYVEQIQPSEFEIELEDLDANSYRSVVTGNLIDSRISRNWTKAVFKFTNLTLDEARSLLNNVSENPIVARIENPIYNTGYVEAQFRCSRKSIKKMLSKDTRYDVSFNLVQKNKVSGM